MAVENVTKKKTKATPKPRAKAAAKVKATSKTRTKAVAGTKAKTTAKTRTKAATGAKARTTAKTETKSAASCLSVDAVMTPNPLVCHPETDLGEVGMLLWEADCGALPVVGLDREILGMVTDRDVCMSLAMSGVRAPEREVAEVMSSPPVCCRPGDDVRSALTAMAEHRVRRLPVADAEGRLAGVVSMADLVRCTGSAIPAADILEAQRRIATPHRKPNAASAADAADAADAGE